MGRSEYQLINYLISPTNNDKSLIVTYDSITHIHQETSDEIWL